MIKLKNNLFLFRFISFRLVSSRSIAFHFHFFLQQISQIKPTNKIIKQQKNGRLGIN